jgi:hypothetical protein
MINSNRCLAELCEVQAGAGAKEIEPLPERLSGMNAGVAFITDG